MGDGQTDAALAAILEPLAPLRQALAGTDAYLVGGAARSLCIGERPEGDLDLAVDGDLEPVLERLGAPARRHARFETATVHVNGISADLARTRRERYPRPGDLPVVEPAPIGEDLARRDFTVNAIAIELAPPHRMLDPFGGCADLRAGVLRSLHPGSFADDPTRAIRAARYCARLGLRPEGETLRGLTATRLGDVSADRRDAELARLAGEPQAVGALALLAEWGLLEIDHERLRLLSSIAEHGEDPPWSGEPSLRAAALLRAARGGRPLEEALRLAAAEPGRPSQAARLAARQDDAALLIAAAAGARWPARWRAEWSRVQLEIDGNDLLAAGVEEGPAVGKALRAVLERKLDGGLAGGRDEELAAALAVAREEAPGS